MKSCHAKGVKAKHSLVVTVSDGSDDFNHDVDLVNATSKICKQSRYTKEHNRI